MLSGLGVSRAWFVFLPLLALLGCGRSKPPYPPEQSLALIELDSGFRIEPFLSEPDVVSPAAMEFDEDGRIYVVEDRGYPLDVEGRVGKVKLIEDTDGDGRPDRVTTFAEGLVLPTGVMRWKQGVLVTDAPDLWYLEDSNGDGVADIRRKVLTGFPLTNPQHTVNSPVYGLDNWIYLAHENPTTAIVFKDRFDDRGSDIHFADKPETAIRERGRNIRFRPEAFELEALSGTSQFGHAFDEFGRHFVLNNTYHARHEVIAARYLARNPDLPVATALEEISDHGIPAPVFPISSSPRIEMLTDVGQFTSACGLTLWRGFAFVAEPAHNLVHRDIYAPAGATFTARRDRPGVEFLASRDPWFRPVNFTVGPDGALYLLDFYRLVIEHPEWMATETYQSGELGAGTDRGRIYRITPRGEALPFAKGLRLSRASPEELVGYLAHDNPWWRRTAQRLLMDRKPAAAAPSLASMAGSHASPVARVHALWTLDGLGQLEPGQIAKALENPVAGVRENAIVLAEPRLTKEAVLRTQLLEMTADPDPRVRFQLLCTLGWLKDGRSQAARDRLLAAALDDRWMGIAALSASPEEAARLFALAVSRQAPPVLFRQAAAVIGARQRSGEMQAVLSAVSRPGSGEWGAAALEGLAAGLRRRQAALSLGIGNQVLAIFHSRDASLRRGALQILEAAGLSASAEVRAAVLRASRTAPDRDADPELRADSIALLALAGPEPHRELLERLVDPAEPEAVQAAAIRALGRIPGQEIGGFLLDRLRGLTPSLRLEAADALYRDADRLPQVVAALREGRLRGATLAFRHRRRLMMHQDPAIREEARRLLESGHSERLQVIARYRAALERRADSTRGREVFRTICANCHTLNGEGAEVGPDLGTMRSQPKQVLLTAILNPSQSISQGFEAYIVETRSGRILDGVLGPQTPTTVTLRQEKGKEEIIPRSEIRSMQVTELSAMPGDLEQQIDIQQMADLLEYLKAAPSN